ncbi:MAG TPA: chloride channel protein, partial [Ktedonobacterales bacterium]|nr:chloride channel protein [Ktedonobacterales bacterium]
SWRRRPQRDEIQAQFSRYTRAYFQRWLFLGAVIGVAAGLVMALFYGAIDLATHLLLGLIAGSVPPQPAGEGATVLTPIAHPWLLPLVTGLGGLIVGVMVYTLAPETARGGTDDVLASFHQRNGMIRKRVAPIKLIASAITIGSGGSAGREGAAAQIMAGIGSWLAQTLHLDEHDRRIAAVAGMGAGIGTIFRAPFAGAIFGAEVLYKRDFEADAIFPTFIAAVVGYTVFGVIVGWQPIFGSHTDFGFHDPRSLVGFLALGVLAGVVGLIFEATMEGVTRAFDRLPISRLLKPALGGVLVGLIGIYLPASLGMGYGFVQFSVNNDYTTLSGLLLALLVFAKIATTSLTLGSGGSGGDVAPAMVAGGFMGGALWAGLHYAVPPLVANISPGAFVLVGMAAFFGGISKTPLAMILMVTEMSGDLSLIAPAMLATMVAYVITGDKSVYHTQPATRIDSPAHRDDYALPLMQRVSVRETLDAVGGATPPVLASDTPLKQAAETLRQSGAPAALAREDGRIIGVFTLSDVARVAPDDLDAMRVAQVISRQIVSAYPDETLYAAWLRMTRRGMRQIVVVERGRSSKRVGLLSLEQVRQVLRLQRLVPRAPAAAGVGESDGAARAMDASPAASLARGVIPPGAAAAPTGDPFAALRVEDAMQAMPRAFAETTPVDELRAAVYRDGCALVVDATGRLAGIIVGRDLRERVASDAGRPLLARDIATRNLVTARRRERLPVAVRRMVRAGVRQLPVVDGDTAGAPVGLLRRTDALAAFDRVESVEEPLTASSGQPPTAPAPSSRPMTR